MAGLSPSGSVLSECQQKACFIRGAVEELRSSRVPPLDRMSWREIERPIPEPSGLVVKKGTKICSLTLSGIGSPSLDTVMHTSSSGPMEETISICPAPVCTAVACSRPLSCTAVVGSLLCIASITHCSLPLPSAPAVANPRCLQ